MRIKELIAAYLNHLKGLGRSPLTVKIARYDLLTFIAFLESEGVHRVEELTREALEEYQLELAFRLTSKGKPLTIRTRIKVLSVIRGFTRYLYEQDYLLSDPGAKLKLPKEPRLLPKVIMSADDIKRMINAPDMRTNQGWRNRIILEILYDTGIRRAEMANIKLADLDLDNGYIHIKGKGNKERVVPLSKRVAGLIRNYIMAIRPVFIKQENQDYLILNRWGGKMHANGVWAVVKRCAGLSGLKKNITTHSFRHACATHMLKNGAPIRHLQELLGHESLDTTQRYTHVTINDLKEVHGRYHPGETMELR